MKSMLRDNRGIAAIEFALLASVLLFLTAGLIEVGRCLQVYRAVNRLALQIAYVWADCTDTPVGTCNTEMSQYVSSTTLKNIAPELTTASVSIRMYQVIRVSAIFTPTYSYPALTVPNAGEVVVATAVVRDGQSGVVVTVSYTHRLEFFPQLMSGILGPALNPSFTVAQMK